MHFAIDFSDWAIIFVHWLTVYCFCPANYTQNPSDFAEQSVNNMFSPAGLLAYQLNFEGNNI